MLGQTFVEHKVDTELTKVERVLYDIDESRLVLMRRAIACEAYLACAKENLATRRWLARFRSTCYWRRRCKPQSASPPQSASQVPGSGATATATPAKSVVATEAIELT